jgi:hypothetical protein
VLFLLLRNEQAIILVGGFGKCQYVFDVLTKAHQKEGILVISPRGDKSDA